jgi:hypothetical protein
MALDWHEISIIEAKARLAGPKRTLEVPYEKHPYHRSHGDLGFKHGRHWEKKSRELKI